MNLLEHYIVKVYSESIITKEWEELTGMDAYETMMLIGMDIDCYGHVEYVEEMFRLSEWTKIKEQGYYLA